MEDTDQHITDVDKVMQYFSDELIEKGKNHDFLKKTRSDEFYDSLISGKIKDSKWYQDHITKERHHLKSHVPDDVNLIDVLEYLGDCVVAGLSRSGDIYDIDPSDKLLRKAFDNTVELLKKEIKVVEK